MYLVLTPPPCNLRYVFQEEGRSHICAF
uniref:Uncharacterized protein n=1 Tax=Anguilla anguilla TaxID=7936 RepID=A0A0E9PK32_ANGAN